MDETVTNKIIMYSSLPMHSHRNFHHNLYLLLLQLSTLHQELEEAKKSVVEFEKKHILKDQIADAAIAARDAAENSLRLADSRTSRIRVKVEELSYQLEQLDNQETCRFDQNRPRYVCRPRNICWPLQWLMLKFTGVYQPDAQEESSNEMELSEPFL